jgi:alpha-2-macroglobulin
VKPAKLKDDETRPNALVVQSAEPLPAGVDWTLVIPAAFTNASGTAKMPEEARFEWGSVQVLRVTKMETEPHFDGPHAVQIQFNKNVRDGGLTEKDEAIAKIASFISISPEVPGKKITLSWSSATIEGDFALNTPYTVSVNAGLPAADGLALEHPVQDKVIFTPSPVFVSTSASSNGQMARGKGVFDLYAANYKELRVRVKQLGEDDLLKARAIHEAEYERFDYDEKNKKPARERLTAFEQLPGKPVFEKVFTNDKPLEKGALLTFNWKDVLGKTPAAPLFVDIEATSQDGAPAGTILNRSIVEFTDIGLIAKDTGKDALVYAYSLQTGEP